MTAYFSQVDRPVVICMVGDHAPSFISSLPAKSALSETEDSLAKRVVPYVMWSNYGVDFSDCTQYSCITDLFPLLAKSSELPLTPYLQTILKVHELVPVRNRSGIYMDHDGNLGIYGDGKYDAIINQHEYLEYYALTAGPDYKLDLFLPK